MISLADSFAFLDNPSINWKYVTVSFAVGKYLFENYLEYRQKHVLRRPSPPACLKSAITQETFEKAQAYSKDKGKYKFFSDTYSLLQNLVFVKYDLLSVIWSFSGRLLAKSAPYLPNFMGGVITQSIFFYATYDVISTILSIPLSYYFTFVLEEKHGFNRSTLGLWISDTITNLAISLVLSVPFAALSLQITDYFGDSFVVYCMIFCMVWMCVVMTVLPSIVSPIFNKFTPIQDEKLKLAIEDLTKKVGFPLDKMYIEDQSKRTGHSNVYITGMPWSKRIIITDTFIDYSTIDEIVAALAHELGHWKMNHVPKRIISYQPQFFVMFTLFSAFIHNRSFYSSFGFADIQPTIIGFYLFYDIYSPVNLFMHFLNNLLSRHQESAADLYAKDLGYVESLCTSLIKISNENLSTFDDVDWLFSAYYRSYPTIAERLTALNYISEGNVSEESK